MKRSVGRNKIGGWGMGAGESGGVGGYDSFILSDVNEGVNLVYFRPF